MKKVCLAFWNGNLQYLVPQSLIRKNYGPKRNNRLDNSLNLTQYSMINRAVLILSTKWGAAS